MTLAHQLQPGVPYTFTTLAGVGVAVTSGMVEVLVVLGDIPPPQEAAKRTNKIKAPATMIFFIITSLAIN